MGIAAFCFTLCVVLGCLGWGIDYNRTVCGGVGVKVVIVWVLWFEGKRKRWRRERRGGE